MKEEIDVLQPLENSTPLYPFNGRAPNLIDKFYIFGYNYLTLKKYLIDQNPNLSKDTGDNGRLGFFHLEEVPSILFEKAYDSQKQLVEPDIIKKVIFPNNLNFYYRKEYNINIQIKDTNSNKINVETQNIFSKVDFSEDKIGCPISKRSVFSIMFPSNDKDGKIIQNNQNGFAYTFYRKLLEKKEIEGKQYIFYIPYTFCIISEFPFFKSFEKLFRLIRKMFSQQRIYIPIEILIHKIIKFTPSPLNSDIILDLDLMVNLKKLFEHAEGNINANPFENKIKFNHLSGYPLIQYNLAKVLFHRLSIAQIIKVFLFIFLEKEIVFFSVDNEYLTLTINAYMNLNYPLNDSQYFYNIGSISLEACKKNELPIFGFKISTSIIAINNRFVPDFYSDKTNKLSERIIVDLDNGELTAENVEGDCYDKINGIVKDVIEEKTNNKHTEKTKFHKDISNLYNHLKLISEKKEIYFRKEFIDFSDEPYVGSIDELNNMIQEAFYECVINLSLYFYDNLLILKEENKNKQINADKKTSMKVEFNKNYKIDEKYKNEELIIVKELLDKSMKYKGSLSEFIIEYNPLDLYKIPLTFTEEFLSFFSRKKIKTIVSKIKYFELINKLYYPKKKSEIVTIDFRSDFSKDLDNYCESFFQEILEGTKDKNNGNYSPLYKVIDYKENKIMQYQTYELHKVIVRLYVNLFEEKNPEYLSLINNNKINEINITEVETIIENFLIDNKYLSYNELCFANIILLFSISLKYFPKNFECNSYLSYLLYNFVIMRKYIVLLLELMFKLYQQSIKEHNNNLEDRMKLCFYSCFNYIRKKNLVPNENLMIILNKFFKLFSDEENNISEIKISNEKKDINIMKEKGDIKEDIIEDIKEDIKEDINEINEKNDFNQINKAKTENDLVIDDEFNFKINEVNLYVYNNFTSVKFYTELNIVKNINDLQNNKFNVKIGDKVNMVLPLIRFMKNKKEKINSIFMSQKVICKILTNEYKKYLQNLDFNELEKKNILDSCLNIFIFIRNSRVFEELDDVMKIMENIFYIFLTKE